MENLKEVLMRRDGLTSEEAEKQISEAREELNRRMDDGEDAEDICMEEFGLEPDYLEDLLDM